MTGTQWQHRVQWGFWLLIGFPLIAVAILAAFFQTGTGLVVLVTATCAYIVLMPVSYLVWIVRRDSRRVLLTRDL